MKKVYIASLVLISIISIALLSSKGKSIATEKQQQKVEIPELLQRNVSLGSIQEIELTMTTYDNLVDEISASPSNMKSRLNMAALFMQEARITGEHGHYYPAALKMLQPVLDSEEVKEDIKFQALSLKAAVYLSLHQFKEVIPIVEEAISINPHNASIYGALVDANVELGNYEEAVKASDKMISIRPDLRSYSRVSYLRQIHGDMPGSIEAMTFAVKAAYPGYEESAWCRLTLGNLYEESGDIEKAEIVYQTILEERPNYPFAIAALGRLEMKKGNLEEAEKLVNKACDIIPEFSFYELRAEIYEKTGREEMAKQTVKEILEMFAEDEAAGHNMGIEYAKLYSRVINDPDKALKYAMKEYDVRPNNIGVNKTLAEIYFQKGNMEKANEHLKKAFVTNTQDPELLIISGLIKMKSGDQKSGLENIKSGLETNPYSTYAWTEEAKTYM